LAAWEVVNFHFTFVSKHLLLIFSSSAIVTKVQQTAMTPGCKGTPHQQSVNYMLFYLHWCIKYWWKHLITS